MATVEYEQLEPSEDHLLLIYEGNPFTGVAVEIDQEERLLSETTFIDGQRNGISREWARNGSLVREQHFKFDALNGKSLSWYETGSQKTEGIYELGICLQEKMWDANGDLVRDFVLEESSAQFGVLRKLRASNLGFQASDHNEN
jgi:antitoxin component YwqK of YwqJK toxin-antitoxin module